MITYKCIINEDNEKLRKISDAVTTPVSNEDMLTLLSLYQYVIQSQDDKLAKELNLRPGVGLASPQIGINKRMFAIFASDGDNLLSLMIINPKILNKSKELIYLNNGEGCLSVKRHTMGVTPRHKKITFEGYVFDPSKNKLVKQRKTLSGYLAIVFQHEFDHLNGKLYIDTMIDEEKAQEQGIMPLWETEEE